MLYVCHLDSACRKSTYITPHYYMLQVANKEIHLKTRYEMHLNYLKSIISLTSLRIQIRHVPQITVCCKMQQNMQLLQINQSYC
jgi:hypothetical protein